MKTSILNEKHTKEIEELVKHLKEACKLYESLPRVIKANAGSESLRAALAESNNLAHQLAWDCEIDTNNLDKS